MKSPCEPRRCAAGLYGRDGLEPVRVHLARRAAFPSRAANFLRLPTALWFYDTLGLDPDTALDLLALAGGAAAGAVAAGAVSSAALGGAWLAYLSLFNVGQTFLSFQWCGLGLMCAFHKHLWPVLQRRHNGLVGFENCFNWP